MPSRPAPWPIVIALVAVVLSAGPARAEWPRTPYVQVELAATGLQQATPVVVSDGEGGAIVAWADRRSGNFDVYAQHVSSEGNLRWAAQGVPLCTATEDQMQIVGVPDGSGGAFFAWRDLRTASGDIYVIRVASTGAIVPGWPANGRLMTHSLQAAKDEFLPSMVADGSGGVLLAWTLFYTPGNDHDIYAGRVNAIGAIDWCTSIDVSAGIQELPSIVVPAPDVFTLAYRDGLINDGDIRVLGRTTAGTPQWAMVLDGAVNETYPLALADGLGGSFVVWLYPSGGGYADARAVRITPSGTLAPGWQAFGNFVGSSVDDPFYVDGPAQRAAADGEGGLYVVWPYPLSGGTGGQHLTPIGSRHQGFDYYGNDLFAGIPNPPRMLDAVGDGQGGLYLIGTADAGGLPAAAMTRLGPYGTAAPGWPGGGPTLVCGAFDLFSGPATLALDPNGRALFALPGVGSGSAIASVAQVVDRFGRCGDVTPTIAAVRDVSGDQGGQVRVDWTRATLDASPAYEISSYWVWRQAPADAAQTALRRGATLLDERDPATAGMRAAEDPAALAPRGIYRRTERNGIATWWEYVTAKGASGFATYSLVAPTTRDSMPGSNPYTRFLIQARHDDGVAFWDSAPDSGYSVDDLPPATPAPFLGHYQTGVTSLSWGANHEPDLSHYLLHRGYSPDFTPDAGNLVLQTGDTAHDDFAGSPAYYKLAAVDVHGNTSPYALLVPEGTLDVPGGPRVTALAFDPPEPHPVRSVARLRFALPTAGVVTLQIFDVSGRRVAVLVHGPRDAGVHELSWEAGRGGVAAGMYFARLTALGRTIERRVLVTR